MDCTFKTLIILSEGGPIMGKQKFNLHTHTARCGHAEGLDIQYVKSAIDAGIELLGFSDHIPYKEIRRADCRMFYEQKEEYIKSIQSLKEKYYNLIDIRIGYEVEYQSDYYEWLMEMKQEVDYMILGQHLKYIGYEYDCYCSDEDVLAYVNQIESALEKGFITYVAHPDYFMMGRRTFSEICREAAHRIASASLKYDVPLEINLNGFRYGKKTYEINGRLEERYVYPFKDFWEIIAVYGCKVLYGYDAHSPIAYLEKDRIMIAEEILKGIPLNFIEEIRLR